VQFVGQAYGLGSIGCLANDVEAGVLHRPPERLPQHSVVVGE
jgi:hypothetical protein